MGTYTYCIGAGAAALEKNNPKFVSYISRGSSAVALGFGVLFVVSAIFGLDSFKRNDRIVSDCRLEKQRD